MNILGFKVGKAEKAVTITNQKQDTEQGEGSFVSVYSPNNVSKLALQVLFDEVAEVNGIIMHLARIASNVTLRHVKVQANGKNKDINGSIPLALLAKPNDLKNEMTFLQEVYASYWVHGNSYINPFKPLGFSSATDLYLLPAPSTFPIPEKCIDFYGTPPSDNDFRFNKILNYHVFFDGANYKTIDRKDMIHVKAPNLKTSGANAYIGQGVLYSAIDNCTTLKYLYETINTILSKRGALGFIKLNTKSGQLETSLTPVEREQIINDMNRHYGVTGGRQPIGVVRQDVSFQKIDAPISEFLPIELKKDIVLSLCRVLGNIPPQIFGVDTNATYNNVKEANKAIYTGAIMPTVELFCSCLTDYFKLAAVGEKIIPDYSDIEALQEDAKLKADTEKATDEVVRARYQNNEITLNEKLAAQGLNPKPDGNKYISEMSVESEPLAIKLGVGGTQALQSILADQGLTAEQKYYTLIYLFGLSEEQAKKLSGYEQGTSGQVESQQGGANGQNS